MHIWIVGKVYTMVFCTIPHLEEQIPQMSNIRTVEKEVAGIIKFITVWALRWCFYFHVVYFFYSLLFYGLIWTEMIAILFPVQL